jgi:HlyD family secretion protein
MALISGSCSAGRQQEEYVSAAARRGDLVVTVAANGSLEALDQVNVTADVAGVVTDVYVDSNDSVEAGQPLCRLDPEHWQLMVARADAQLSTAQAAWQSAKDALKAAESALDRAERRAKSAAARSSLEGLRASVTQARADEQLSSSQVAGAITALDAARTALDHTLIQAPISGVVVSRLVQPGQNVTVSESAHLLFVLARDVRRMELGAFIDEADIGQLAVGQSASFSVDAFPERTFPAKLTAIHNIALRNADAFGFEARLEVDNSDSTLRPGMIAKVAITTLERKAALLLPNGALRFTPEFVLSKEARSFAHPSARRLPEPPSARDTARTIWAMPADGQPRARRVAVGSSDGEWTEVLADGVQPGETFAVDMRVRRD